MPTSQRNSLSGLSPRDDPMNTLSQRHFGLSRLALLAGVVVFVIVSFWGSFESLFALWQQTDHRHGTLVFPIAAFLIWRLRPEVEHLAIAGEPKGLLILVALLFAWVVAHLAGIQVAEHVLILTLIPATVYTVAGGKLTVKLLFPLLFLILATPIGDALVPHLMVITADISTALLRVSGIPVLRDGQYISLPGGNFVVADVCSGVRYLTTGIMIALLYSHLTYRSYCKWIVFAAVMAIVLVVTNGIRAYLVMAIASATDLRYFGGRDHIYFGWVLFGVVTMLLMWFGGRYADHHVHLGSQKSSTNDDEFISPSLPLIVVLGLIMLATTTNPLQADLGNTSKYLILVAVIVGIVLLAGRSGGPIATSNSGGQMTGAGIKWRSIVTITAAALLLVAAPRSVKFIEHGVAHTVTVPVLENLDNCTTPRPWANRWSPKMQDPDIEEAVTMTCAGQPLSIYLAGYTSGLQGKELISSSNRLIPGSLERHVKRSSVEFRDIEGRVRQVNEVGVDGRSFRSLIWYWYDIDGRWATGEYEAKTLQMVALLRTRPTGGQVILIETPVNSDEGSARQRIESVANDLINGDKAIVRGKSD